MLTDLPQLLLRVAKDPDFEWPYTTTNYTGWLGACAVLADWLEENGDARAEAARTIEPSAELLDSLVRRHSTVMNWGGAAMSAFLERTAPVQDRDMRRRVLSLFPEIMVKRELRFSVAHCRCQNDYDEIVREANALMAAQGWRHAERNPENVVHAYLDKKKQKVIWKQTVRASDLIPDEPVFSGTANL